MIDVIVIGQNYNTSLGIIKSVGEAGFSCATVSFQKENVTTLRSRIKKMLSPDLCSKYISSYAVIRRNPEDALVEDLIKEFGEKGCKALILPADDYCAQTLDRNKNILSSYFYVPHITNSSKELSYFLDKKHQKEIAQKIGIDVAGVWSVNIEKGKVIILPKGIKFPCITKPQSSIGLPKSFIRKCNNEKELKDTLIFISRNYSCDILVEEYIDIEQEYTIPGISNGTEVMIPAFLKKTVVGKGSHKGVTICGVVKKSDRYIEIKEKLLSFIQSIGFTGIFDIEVLYSQGKFYLNEINFRNGAAGYSLTKAGINLYDIYTRHILRGDNMDIKDDPLTEMSFVNDKAAFEYFIQGECSWNEYKHYVNDSEVRFIEANDDSHARNAFRVMKYISFLKHIKRIL